MGCAICTDEEFGKIPFNGFAGKARKAVFEVGVEGGGFLCR